MTYTITITNDKKLYMGVAIEGNRERTAYSTKSSYKLPYTMTLESMNLHKQIYSPNSICLKFTVDTNGTSIFAARANLKEMLLGATLSISLSNDKDEMSIVKGYKVFDLRYSSSLSNIELTIEAYSPDKSAALNCHSECFTGRTIDEILYSTLTRFSFEDETSATNDKYKYSSAKSRFLHYYFEDTPTSTSTRIGHIIPYAVQYNESSYSFLRRLAIRHGEALYWEDESLRVGFQPLASDKILTIDAGCIEKLEFEDSTESRDELYVGENYMESALSYFATSGTDSSKMASIENAQFSNAASSSADATEKVKIDVVVDEYATNDNYVDLRKELKSFTTAADENSYLSDSSNFEVVDGSLLTLYEKAHYIGGAVSTVGDVLNNNGLVGAAVDIALNAKSLTYDTYANATSLNLSYLNEVTDDKGNLLEGVRYNDGAKGRSNSKFINHFSFIADLLRESKKARESRVIVSLNNTLFCKGLGLGSRVKLGSDKTEFVVCDMIISDKEYNTLPTMRLELIPYVTTDNNGKGITPIFDSEDMVKRATTQTAIVVDTKDPYQLNRVRICYPWQLVGESTHKANTVGSILSSDDFSDTLVAKLRSIASPWIRVSSPSTMGDGGVIMLPSLYSEVHVGYERGNICRPYVEGSFFKYGDEPFAGRDNENTSVISSRHGQKIVFHDGNSGISFFTGLLGPFADLGLDFLPAGVLEGTQGENIAPFDGYTELTDRYGINSVKLSASDREISLKSALGKISINALTGISIEAPNGDIEIKGKNISISAGNKLSLTSGKNITRPDQVSSTKLSLITSINDAVGIDLSLVRCIIEAFCKPIGGNMVIKSNRYLCMEAGRGDAHISKFVRKNIFEGEGDAATVADAKPIKEPILHFLRIFDNCKVAIDQIKEAERAYINRYNSPAEGYEKILCAFETYIVSSRIDEVKKQMERMKSPEKIKELVAESSINFSTSSLSITPQLDIDFEQDLKIPEVADIVASLIELCDKLSDTQIEYKRVVCANYNKLKDEISHITGPLQELITERFFGNSIPPLTEFCDYNSKDTYKVVRQAIYGEIAAKRVILLIIMQLLQEQRARAAFNLGGHILQLDLPDVIAEIVNKSMDTTLFNKQTYASSTLNQFSEANKAAGREFEINCTLKIKDSNELTAEEISDVNATWRYLSGNIFTDEEMSYGDMIMEAIGIDGLMDDFPYHKNKGVDIDRQTLDDGTILLSNNKHITHRYEATTGEFVISDTTYDNEIVGKLKEVMTSLNEEIF